jgi:hypothetical protein
MFHINQWTTILLVSLVQVLCQAGARSKVVESGLNLIKWNVGQIRQHKRFMITV